MNEEMAFPAGLIWVSLWVMNEQTDKKNVNSDLSALMKAAQVEGTESALNNLLEYVQQHFFGYLLWRTRSREDAKDLMQALVISMAKHYRRIRRVSAVPRWIYKVADGLSAKWVKKQLKKRRVVFVMEMIEEDKPRSKTPFDEVAERNNLEKLRSELDNVLLGLPCRLRWTIEMGFMEYCTPNEIARRLGVDVESVYHYRVEALQRMQKHRKLKRYL